VHSRWAHCTLVGSCSSAVHEFTRAQSVTYALSSVCTSLCRCVCCAYFTRVCSYASLVCLLLCFTRVCSYASLVCLRMLHVFPFSYYFSLAVLEAG
jgi:hypothetical protein